MFTPYSTTPSAKSEIRHVEIAAAASDEQAVAAAKKDTTVIIRDFALSTTKNPKTPGAAMAARIRERTMEYTKQHSIRWFSSKKTASA